MDKSSFLIGMMFIIGGFALMIRHGNQQEEYARNLRALEEEKIREEAARESRPIEQQDSEPRFGLPDEEELEPGSESTPMDLLTEEVKPMEVPPPSKDASELVQEVILRNEYILVRFTTRGAGIEEVRFLRTRAGEEDEFVFNEFGEVPALTLSVGEPRSRLALFLSNFSVLEAEENRVVFGITLPQGLELQREYRLAAPGEEKDPYLIEHTTTLVNRTRRTLPGERDFYFSLGTAGPLISDLVGEYTSFGFSSQENEKFFKARRFRASSGVLGIGARAETKYRRESLPVAWATVKNQYFAAVYTPENPGTGYFTSAVDIPGETLGSPRVLDGITGFVGVDVPVLGKGERHDFRGTFYVGPKEYRRLNDLGARQDAVMDFGFFGFFSRLLLFVMYAIHAVIPSWGWSIVVMTIFVKLLFWPLTAKAARSQKRMQQIQGPLKEIAEKYKDNPDKKNRETIKLFREAKINPAAGCLPILIQIPIFLGLFMMLRTASELRHAPFLWINDLSRPDTVAEIFGFPINLMPLLMGVTMFFQMRMMPAMTTGDPLQQKIFRYLPVVFLVILYNFSSGLVVYWTVQNLLTILQQWLTNRKQAEPLEISTTVQGKGRKMRSVGPKRKAE